MNARFILFVSLFVFLTSSMATAGEALKQPVHNAAQQEKAGTSRSLAKEGEDGKKIPPETNPTSQKEFSRPPSAPNGLKILPKSK
jgi:hypothetical protein